MRLTQTMRMETADEILVERAQTGDGEAFASLVTRHYDLIFRLAFRTLGSREAAQDLAQDVCAALPAKMTRYTATARFTTWLYRVVVNAAHDRRRRAASRSKAADGWGDWEQNRQAANRETAEQIDWLTRAMSALPEDLRDTLALVLDDMTHSEAGEVLGISEGTVSWRISEAKKRLKTLKQEEETA